MIELIILNVCLLFPCGILTLKVLTLLGKPLKKNGVFDACLTGLNKGFARSYKTVSI